MNRLTKWTDRLLLVLTVFTVTFFIYRDFDIRMLYGFAALGLILLVSFLRRLALDRPLEPEPVRGALLWLAAVVLVNFLRPDSQHSADTISYIISMVVCVAFVWLWQDSPAESGWSTKLLLAAAVGMTAFVLLYRLFPDFIYAAVYPHLSDVAQRYFDYFLPRSYGMAFGGYTFTDYVIFCGIAVCWGRIAAAERRSVRDLLRLGAILIFGIAILTLGRRGELLGAVVLCALTMLMLCTPKMRILLILGGGALLAAALWLFLRFLPQLREIEIFYRYVRTIENLVNGYDFTSGRTDLFALAIEGFRSAPIFGIGFDQFYTLVNPLLTDIEGNVMQDAHNIYLQFLCEIGLVGTVLVLLPMFWLLLTTLRAMTAARKQEGKRGVEALTVSFLIQSYLLFLGLLDPTFQKIVFWCFYAVSAMLLLTGMEQSGWRPNDPLSRLFGKTAALASPIGRRVWEFLRTFFH